MPNQGHFLKISFELAKRTDLTLAEKFILGYVEYKMGRNKECWPGCRTIASDLGMNRFNILRCAAHLAEIGELVVAKPGNGQVNCYSIPPESGDKKQPLPGGDHAQKATGDKKQPVTKSHTPGDKKQPEAVTKSHHKRQNQEENHSAATPRERNKYWDAICDIFGMKPVTKQDESRLGKLSRDFKLKCEADGAAPDEIDARREVLSVRWAKNDKPAVVTPEALLKHWDSAKEIREDPFDIRPVTPEEEAQMQAEVDAIPEADFIAQYHAWIARVSPDKISRINPRAVRLGLPIPPGLTLDKDGFVVNPVVQEGAVE